MDRNSRIHNQLEWRSLTAFIGFIIVCFFAVFTPGGPVQGTHGIVFAGVGLLIALFPPVFRVSRWIWIPCILLILLSSLVFLPADWFGKNQWRGNLEALGVDLGGSVTAHPAQTLEFLMGLGISICVATYLLGLSISSKGLNLMGFLISTGIAIYALISMLAIDNHWDFAWDIEPTFGFFPNRNHSASLLAMGAIGGLGVLYQSIVTKRYVLAAITGVSLGLNAYGLLGYSISRAGPLLFGVGGIIWLCALGRKRWNFKLAISLAVLGGLAILLFFASDSAVKKRLADTVETEEVLVESESQSTTKDPAFDFRVLIYKDTFKMLKAEPITGVGLGMFKYVFPQYREASSTNSICLHPESDWLLLATETGVLSALALMLAVGSAIWLAVQNGVKTKSWPLRLSLIIAAGIVPLHGLFDVPGHRIGLAYFALVLIALGSWKPKGTRRLGKLGKLGYQSAGMAILIAGVLMIHGQWFGGYTSAIVAADVSAQMMRDLHAEDMAMADDPENAVEGEDKIEQAIKIGLESAKLTPLDQETRYLLGAMGLYFDDKDQLVRQSFAAQRLLEPNWVELPLRQAVGWLPIAPNETISLWKDAMNRAEKMAGLSDAMKGQPGSVWNRILRDAKSTPSIYGQLPEIAENQADRLLLWMRGADPDMLKEKMPIILGKLTTEEPSTEALLEAWAKCGRPEDVEKYRFDHP